MHALITGGAGFIGHHLAQHLLAQNGTRVRILDDFSTGKAANLQGLPVEIIKGSITEPAIVLSALQGIDVVFHLAAMASVTESLARPQACRVINLDGTINVLEAASDTGVGKLVFASTCAVYGDDPQLPKRENQPTKPISPYAETKCAAEEQCRFFAAERSLPTAVLRFFNVFGPGQDPHSDYAAAIPLFIARAVSGQPLTIFGDGKQTRDFVSVHDVTQACLLAAEHDLGTANVASGQPVTIQHVAERIIELTGSDSSIEYAAEREGEIRHSHADISHLRSFGFTPADPLAALPETVEYYRSNSGTPRA